MWSKNIIILSSEKYPFDQHVEFGLGRPGKGATLETKELFWRLTRKWALWRQWGLVQRVLLDSTWRCSCRDGRGWSISLTPRTPALVAGSRGDSSSSHQDGKGGWDQAWGERMRCFGGLMSLQVCEEM